MSIFARLNPLLVGEGARVVRRGRVRFQEIATASFQPASQ